MNRIRVSAKTWVLVCDGSKALLFQNAGDAQAITLKIVERLVETHPPTRDLGTDRPGRVHESMGSSRSSMEDTDWHQRAEDKFVREIAAKIDALVRSAAITALVVAAPPKVLGELRNCMSQASKELIVGEIAKDMVKLPTAEIERHLAATGELR